MKAQLQRMEERKQAAEAIAQSTAAWALLNMCLGVGRYHEKRAVPKKVKKKGKSWA